MWQHAQELLRGTRVGDEEEHVVRADDAQVAVEGLCGVEEDGADGETLERGDELLRNEARLADADEDELAVGAGGVLPQDGADGRMEASLSDGICFVQTG